MKPEIGPLLKVLHGCCWRTCRRDFLILVLAGSHWLELLSFTHHFSVTVICMSLNVLSFNPAQRPGLAAASTFGLVSHTDLGSFHYLFSWKLSLVCACLFIFLGAHTTSCHIGETIYWPKNCCPLLSSFLHSWAVNKRTIINSFLCPAYLFLFLFILVLDTRLQLSLIYFFLSHSHSFQLFRNKNKEIEKSWV